MPFNPINTGTAPDDNTGDVNRDCWLKANAMFNELYTLLASAATQTGVNALIANLTALVNAATATANGKPSYDDLALKAALTQVVRSDGSFPLPQAARLLAAANAGLAVTLPFRLLANDESVDIGDEWDLPPLPNNFALQDAQLVFFDGSDCTVAAVLRNAATAAAYATGSANVGEPVGKLLMNPNNAIPALTPLKLVITAVQPGYGAINPKGLYLWLRGVWL
jgi:hypothetical protein